DAVGRLPTLAGTNGEGWLRIPQIGPAYRVESAGRYRKRAVDGVGAAMGADDIAILRPRNGADDGAALARAWRAPADREARLGARRRVRSQTIVVRGVSSGHSRPQKNQEPAGLDGHACSMALPTATHLAAAKPAAAPANYSPPGSGGKRGSFARQI